MPRHRVLLAILLLCSVSTFAQDRPSWRTARDIGEGARGTIAGTVIDVDSGRNRLQIETDEGNSRVLIEADSVATEYHGFGTVIADRPEIFTGNTGFANIRLGDRVEVRGTGRGSGAVAATYITLLGRPVEAGSVGVGSTRSPSSPTNPTIPEIAATPGTGGTTTGTIRQINADEGRLVIQTADRRMLTVRTARTTPVIYRGEQYRVTNLEVGDRVRIVSDTAGSGIGEIAAARIEVVEGAQEAGNVPSTGNTFATIQGTVARVDAALDYAWIDTGREQIRVDMSRAETAHRERIGARDLAVGDAAEISGSYNRVGDIFIATTVRSGTAGSGGAGRAIDAIAPYGTVTIDGTVTATLEEATTIAIRTRDSGATLRLWATDDFVVRLRTGTTTAEKLRSGDTVRVRAFRDAAGDLIAQTIMVRNR